MTGRHRFDPERITMPTTPDLSASCALCRETMTQAELQAGAFVSVSPDLSAWLHDGEPTRVIDGDQLVTCAEAWARGARPADALQRPGGDLTVTTVVDDGDRLQLGDVSDLLGDLAGHLARAAGLDGRVSRAVMVVEWDADDGTDVEVFSTEDLPWDTHGLLGYGAAKVVAVDLSGSR